MAQVEVDRAKLDPLPEPIKQENHDSSPEPTEENARSKSPTILRKRQKRYYVPTGRPRGRPRKDPAELARPRPGTRPRGRPRKSESPSASSPPAVTSQRKLRAILPKPPSRPVQPAANESIIGSVLVVNDPCHCSDDEAETKPSAFVIPPPITVIHPQGRPRGRPRTISKGSPLDPPRFLLTQPTISQPSFIPDDPPAKRGRGRPRIHPRPPPGTPRRGRGRPRIHHRPEDIIIRDLTLEEELDRLHSLVMKKDTIIKRLKRQLTRLQEADDEHLMRVKLEMNEEKEEDQVYSSDEGKPPSDSES